MANGNDRMEAIAAMLSFLLFSIRRVRFPW